MQSGSDCVVDRIYFDARTTYAWRSAEKVSYKDDTGYVSPLILDALVQGIDDALQRKGLQKATSNPDMEIAVDLTIRRELRSITQSTTACSGLGCWEVVGMESGAQYNVVTVGFLALDVYAENKAVWRSWVERNLYPSERDNYTQVLDAAVAALTKPFPP